MDNVTLYPGVDLGQGTEVESYCIIGKPPRGTKSGEKPLIIGSNSVIRAFTVIYADSTIGNNFQSGHHVMIREDNVIGFEVSIGTSSSIEFGNRIGNRVRIHSGCFLERTTIEDDVFIGPNVVFTDDPHPMCPKYLECKRGAHIGRFSRIGANTTLLPGVIIGKNCLIGAGSLVNQNIPDGMVAVGNPIRIIKRVDELTCDTGIFERPYIWMDD